MQTVCTERLVGVDVADDLRASDAIDPVAHATEVAVGSALARGHLFDGVRLQSMHEDPGQEVRGAEMRTNVTVPSQCVVVENAGNPVAEVHHASNHEQGRLLQHLRAVRVVRSWQLLAPDQDCQYRDAEATPSVPPRASFDRSRVVVCRAPWTRAGRAACHLLS